MRRHLSQLFEREEGFTVLAVRNGIEALAELEKFDPDVITLDVNMPDMDGITCLSRIMVQKPKPVVMVSSLTEEGALVTFEALELGAVDYVQKPQGTISLDIGRIEHELISKVRAAATARIRRSRGLRSRLSERHSGEGVSAREKRMPPVSRDKLGVVLIGVSTGGPSTLEEILPLLPADFPWAVVVAQHMPSSFTGVFARRLSSLSQIPVIELARPTILEAGCAYIAKGDADVLFSLKAAGIAALPAPASSKHLWHPSVTRMVESAMEILPPERLMAVQLTGMGDDGAKPMAELHRKGARTIAQDEDTSIVFGMPAELIRLGGADAILPMHRIADQIVAWLSSPSLTKKLFPRGS
jgi:two-component system chemotaxis response regulator CheB